MIDVWCLKAQLAAKHGCQQVGADACAYRSCQSLFVCLCSVSLSMIKGTLTLYTLHCDVQANKDLKRANQQLARHQQEAKDAAASAAAAAAEERAQLAQDAGVAREAQAKVRVSACMCVCCSAMSDKEKHTHSISHTQHAHTPHTHTFTHAVGASPEEQRSRSGLLEWCSCYLDCSTGAPQTGL